MEKIEGGKGECRIGEAATIVASREGSRVRNYRTCELDSRGEKTAKSWFSAD